MRTFASLALCIVAAASARAFDSAEWHGKRELLLREAERLQAAYSNCVASLHEPAEDITVPVETYGDGSVKTVVAARRARFFLREGLIWAEGVVIRKFAEDGAEESRIDAASCVVDRAMKSGWAEGPARVRHGRTTFCGSGVYFSSPESYVHVSSRSEIDTTDLSFGGSVPAKPAKKGKASAKDGSAAGAEGPAEGKAPEPPSASMTVKSGSSDIDRKAGVVLLEGDVDVVHSDGYGLTADRVYLFLSAASELSRVVASGNVVLTNASRTATCPLATYRRAKREVEMFGDGKDVYARLVEAGAERRELEGRRIRFWLDTEQVEVDGPLITVGGAGKGVVP